MQTTYTGQKAEQAAAEFLTRQGYTILDRNWRKRECEIDIVAFKSATIHFVEVKYRQTEVAGSGLEYITQQKLKRMSYAAERWIAEKRWTGQYVLSAVEVGGMGFQISDFIECIEY